MVIAALIIYSSIVRFSSLCTKRTHVTNSQAADMIRLQRIEDSMQIYSTICRRRVARQLRAINGDAVTRGPKLTCVRFPSADTLDFFEPEKLHPPSDDILYCSFVHPPWILLKRQPPTLGLHGFTVSFSLSLELYHSESL